MAGKSVILVGFSFAVGLGLAAQTHAQASDAAFAAQFHRLDKNGNGVLSLNEAAADPKVRALYRSLDTSANIEHPGKNVKPGGITIDQFVAGMQAARNGGTVGPPAAGGATYKVYPDGSREKVPGTGIPAAN